MSAGFKSGGRLMPPPVLAFKRKEAESQVVAGGRPEALSHDVILARLHARLQRLDAEQLQVVEIVVAAITRGAR